MEMSMLANSGSGSWVTILIIIIWAGASILEARRKRRLKAQKEYELRRRAKAAQREDVATTDPQEETSPEPPKAEPRALQEAEDRARQESYRPVPVGPDLQTRVEDLLKGMGVPLPEEMEMEEVEEDIEDRLALLEKENLELRQQLSLLRTGPTPQISARQAAYARSQHPYDRLALHPYAQNESSFRYPSSNQLRQRLRQPDELKEMFVIRELLSRPKAMQSTEKRWT